MDIRSRNVFVKNCKISKSPTPGFGAIRVHTGASVVLENCEIFLSSFDTSASVIGNSNFTLRKCYIHSITEGPRANGNVLIEDCYITGMVRTPGEHVDAIQVTNGDNIIVRHCTIDIYDPFTEDFFNSAVIAKADFGAINNVTVEDCLLNGGNYTLYFVTSNFEVNDVICRRNRFGRNYQFGPLSVVGVSRFTYENNVWDDDNSPVNLGGD